jgi:hypothetical protein
MRPDMKKVIVSNPKCGGRYSKFAKAEKLTEDSPNKESRRQTYNRSEKSKEISV